MPRGPLWTEREDRLIREAAAANLAEGLRTPEGRHKMHTTKADFSNRLAEVARKIGRTYVAVNLRACRIGARSRPERAGKTLTSSI